jgi:hypothetical protein
MFMLRIGVLTLKFLHHFRVKGDTEVLMLWLYLPTYLLVLSLLRNTRLFSVSQVNSKQGHCTRHR